MRRNFLALVLTFSTLSFAESKHLPLLQGELALSGGTFFAVGASNTGGFGLSVGLRDRVLAHLKTNNLDVLEVLKKNKQCFGLMIDRFFPTAFPHLADEKLKEEELKTAFDEILEALLKTGCSLVVVDLFNPLTLTATQKQIVETQVPLSLMALAMNQADSESKRTTLVNKWLAEAAQKNPKLTVLSFNQKMEPLTDSTNLQGLAFSDLFQHGGQDIHVNYSGQAHLFNIYGKDALEKVAGVKVAPITFQKDYSEKWEKEILGEAASLSPSLKGTAKIMNSKELLEDSHQLDGKTKKGKMTKVGDLKLIDKVIRQALGGNNNASFPIFRSRENGKVVYELDFTNLSFAKIKLFPSEDSKVFVGMGTDYWGYALGFSRLSSKAYTNYVFELKEIDDQNVQVTWTILPQLEVAGEIQTISDKERKTSIDEKKWVDEIEANTEDYQRLVYVLQTQLQWSGK